MSEERAIPRIIPVVTPEPPPLPIPGATWSYNPTLRETCNACLTNREGGFHFGDPVYCVYLCAECAEDLTGAVVATRRAGPRSMPPSTLVPDDVTLELSFCREDDLGVLDVSYDPEPRDTAQEIAMMEEAAMRLYAYVIDYRAATGTGLGRP